MALIKHFSGGDHQSEDCVIRVTSYFNTAKSALQPDHPDLRPGEEVKSGFGTLVRRHCIKQLKKVIFVIKEKEDSNPWWNPEFNNCGSQQSWRQTPILEANPNPGGIPISWSIWKPTTSSRN